MTVLSVLRGARRKGHPENDVEDRPPGDAIVLSGGGSLGAVQAGALHSLLEAGVQPELFVGCSVGALNGAFIAVDPSVERAERLEALWQGLERAQVFPASRRSVAGHLVRRDAHLYESDGLHALVDRWIAISDLATTKVPCHVVTTDLLAGEPCWWSAGDPHGVLVASASLPGLLPPVELGGSLHVDGGVVCPVPTQRALELGARRVWILDVTGGSLGRRDERMTALDVLLISFAISRNRLGRSDGESRPGQELFRLPHVTIGRHDLRDFSRTPELLEMGREAGRRMASEAFAARAG
jgi:NTE family protein